MRAERLHITSVLAGAAMLVGGTGRALTPLPPCVWNAESGQLEYDSDALGNHPYAFVTTAGEGFASSAVDGGAAYDHGPERFILQHCPTGAELSIVLPEGENNGPLINAYEAMVWGEAPYTLRQIGERLAQMGAGIRMTENQLGDCACDWLFGEG